MAYSDVPTVRLEREPHRDAVVRLREAYKRLRLARQQFSTDPAQDETTVQAPITVQEVSS